MSLNNLGLGFVFNAIDKGLTKGAEAASKSITGVGDAVKSVRSVSYGVGSMLSAAFRLPDINHAIGTLNQFASDMRITTTQHEAYGVMASKVAKRVTAGFALNSKEAKKWESQIASTAFALNADVGSVADSFKALKQNEIDVTKLGFKSFKEFQQFAEVTGLDVKKFAAASGHLKKQVGLTDQELGNMLDTGVAIGKQFGLGTDAVQGMVDTVSMLQEEAAGMFQTMGKDRTKKFIQDTQILAGAFMKAGHTVEESEQLARGLGQALMKGEQGIRGLYAGLQADLPDVAQILTENFGGAEDAFKLLQESPLEFAKKMTLVTKKIRQTSKDPEKDLLRFNQQMMGAFGPQVVNLITGGMDDSLDSIQKLEGEIASGKLKGGLHDVAKAYSDGRTMAERFSLAQDLFRTKLKHLNSELMTDSEFLGKYKKATSMALDALKPMASGNGMVAKATRLMIEFSNFGIGGVLSTMHPLGPALVSLAQQFGPIMQALPGLLGVVKALASPITVVAGAVFFLAKYFRDSARGGSDFTKMVDGIVERIPELVGKVIAVIGEMMPKVFEAVSMVFSKVGSWLQQIDWNRVGAALVSALSLALQSLAQLVGPLIEILGKLFTAAFQALAGIDWSAVGSFMVKLGVSLFEMLAKGLIAAAKGLQWITAALAHVNWDAVGKALVKGTAMVIGLMLKVTWEILKALPNLFVAVFKLALGLIKAVWNDTMKWLDDKLGAFAVVAKAVVFGIAIAFGALATAWVAGWVAMQASAIGALIAGAAGAVAFWAVVLGPITLVIAGIAAVGYAVYKLINWFSGAKKASKELSEAQLKHAQEQAASIHKVIGVMHEYKKVIDETIKAYSTNTEYSIQLSKRDADAVQQSALTKMNAYQQEYTALREMLTKSEITQAEFAARESALNARRSDEHDMIVRQQEFAVKREAYLSGQHVEMAKYVSDAYIYYTNQWAQNDEDELRKVGPKFRDMISERLSTLNKGYAEELAALKNQNFATVAEYEAARQKIESHYADLRHSVSDVIAQSHDEITRASDADVASVEKSLTKIDARLEQTAKTSESKAEQMARGVKDVFNVTESEANDLLKSLMGVDPKIFQKDVEKVRSSYVKFLNAVVAEGVKLLVTTRTQFTLFMAEQIKFWGAMETFVTGFIDRTSAALSKFWSGVIFQAAQQMNLLGLVIRQMAGKLQSMVSDVNLMLLITDEDKIMQWAVLVVSALQRALLGSNNPFDAAMASAARNASAFIDTLAEKRGSLGNVTMKYESTASQAEKNEALQSLIVAVNRPAWEEDMRAEMTANNAELTRRLDALILVTSGKKQTALVERLVHDAETDAEKKLR